jgi:hypothetical protein
LWNTSKFEQLKHDKCDSEQLKDVIWFSGLYSEWYAHRVGLQVQDWLEVSIWLAKDNWKAVMKRVKNIGSN